MSEQNSSKLSAQEVLAAAQRLFAENLTSGEDVRNVLCTLAGDILVNGFKTERMDARISFGNSPEDGIMGIVSISAEVYQKLPVTLPQQPDSADDGETSPTEHSGRTADGKASLAEQFDRQ